jgi:phthiodiolone/phenolphthiodiolone dimycocerosates ketoreductase
MADHIGGLIASVIWGSLDNFDRNSCENQTHKTFCCMTDPFRRHPAQTAQAVATLDRFSNGRVGIGVGAGESMNLLPFGLDWRTENVLRLKEATEVIKLLFDSSSAKPVKY